jgi:hypothetical protein
LILSFSEDVYLNLRFQQEDEEFWVGATKKNFMKWKRKPITVSDSKFQTLN